MWAALRRSHNFTFLYSATTKLSTKLCETTAVTSTLGSDLELSETIECESLTCEVESETEFEIEKEATLSFFVTLFFFVRTSFFLAEAEPEPNVLIFFWRFEPETFLIMFLRLIA